ncbi:LptA/OstA family protein [Rhizobium tubonense]|uniref:LPS ABC transporter substrate-binding protein LptA n=1 Tax=Rhizobium tubonense TaxID=484088 RepID=A0A2W4ECB1_9HYPH|nr:LptA/OstA family protein [Rhizobium tubonense]PZM12176.1 LPS ABC transporter substrate-binding protein LptA [Rhizobium tubonense]
MTNNRRILFSSTVVRKAALAGAVAVFSLIVAAGAEAQTSTTKQMPGLQLSKDQPIQIESDKLEIHDQDSTAVFTGKVNVVQGTTTMQAGKMIVFYKKKPQPDDAANAKTDSAAKPAATASTDTKKTDAKKPATSDSVVSGDADIDHILVSDKVYIVSGTQTATADNGSFDMAGQLAILKGDKVVLTDGPNVFTGCQLTVHMQTGEAQLDSCGGRVQIQLDPKSKPTPQKTN